MKRKPSKEKARQKKPNDRIRLDLAFRIVLGLELSCRKSKVSPVHWKSRINEIYQLIRTAAPIAIIAKEIGKLADIVSSFLKLDK